ncbi:MAG: hypothetical protein ACI94D_002543, partial [Neolewinella sp.]
MVYLFHVPYPFATTAFSLNCSVLFSVLDVSDRP